ncbi:unnamed protein product, partial [Caenorhabditis auriculariae]
TRMSVYSLPSDYTEENPWNKRELIIFIVCYTSCVLFLIVMYEILMPVINNPMYPYYNAENVPSYAFQRPDMPR